MKVLVVAHKYNDIYYAQSVIAQRCTTLPQIHLILFGKPEQLEGAAWLPPFEQITYIAPKGFYKNLVELLLMPLGRYDIALTSNIDLQLNKVLLKHAKEIIQLEDGMMNYLPNYRPYTTPRKRMVERLLGVNRLKERITHSYLLAPQQAHYAYGKRCKLTLPPLTTTTLSLDNAKVFVGQNLYVAGYCTIEEYNERVNQLIQQEGITHYIPHAFASPEERIDAPKLDLWSEKVTLEMVADALDSTTLYGYNSSVLFTVKQLNPKVQCVAVRDNRLNISYPEVLSQGIDRWIEL